MALMLLIKSLLFNASGLLVFFLFGLGEGIFHGPLENLSIALKCLSVLPSQLVLTGGPRTPRSRSVKVTELLDAVDASSTSTGYEDAADLFKVVCRAKAASLITIRMKEWAERARSGVGSRSKAAGGKGYYGGGGGRSANYSVAFKPAGRRAR